MFFIVLKEWFYLFLFGIGLIVILIVYFIMF